MDAWLSRLERKDFDDDFGVVDVDDRGDVVVFVFGYI